jgi:geranylgeranyl reductase family protein
MLDVAIIGGGPGGLYTGLLLARAGFSATVIEEHTEVGRPVHCTGVLADDAFSEFGLPRSCVLNALSTATFVAPGGSQVSYTTPQTEAIVIDRGALDATLAVQAQESGVELRLGRRARDVRISDTSARIEMDEGVSLEARAVVLACGASYGLQRRLGLGVPPVALNSAQLELPAGRSGDVEVYFGSSVAPEGFAWAVPVARPHGHHVRIGLMCRGDAAAMFRALIARIGPSWGVAVDAVGEPRRRYLPLSTLPRTFASRVLAVGDAAGLVKPTTGGGIYYSLASASMAAETLVDALRADRLDDEALQAYQQRWRTRFGPELRAQLALRMLAQRLSDPEIDSFFELARTNGVMPLVKRAARFNQHRHLITELFRHAPARRLLFRRVVASI